MESAWVFEVVYNKWPKKTTSSEMLQSHWENMHFRLGQKNYLLEILWLGENRYKTLGNQ